MYDLSNYRVIIIIISINRLQNFRGYKILIPLIFHEN